jgi:hypothetical protein
VNVTWTDLRALACIRHFWSQICGKFMMATFELAQMNDAHTKFHK